MYQFKQILKTDLKNLYTNPMWWASTIGLPLLLTIVMSFMTKDLYGANVTSYDYYAITMLIFGALNNSTLAANSFMEGRIVKANMRLCNAPIQDFFIFMPKVIASFLFGTVCHIITAIILFFFADANFGGSSAVYLVILLMSINFFSVCFSILLCCLFKNEETVNMILSTIVMLFCVLGGVFFPMQGMSNVIRFISSISPVTWIISAAFQTIYDGKLLLLGYACFATILLSFMCLLLTTKLFNREDYL